MLFLLPAQRVCVWIRSGWYCNFARQLQGRTISRLAWTTRACRVRFFWPTACLFLLYICLLSSPRLVSVGFVPWTSSVFVHAKVRACESDYDVVFITIVPCESTLHADLPRAVMHRHVRYSSCSTCRLLSHAPFHKILYGLVTFFWVLNKMKFCHSENHTGTRCCVARHCLEF